MINFLWNHLHMVPNLTFEMDHYGNLFITKNTTNPEYYPCVIAHMDCIKTWTGERSICEIDDVFYGQNIADGSSAGLSADDGAGIYAAIEILNVIPNLKICFTTEEEIGAIGAQQACYNTDFFYNVSYFLQADRRGSSDLIAHTNGIDVCSNEFLKIITKSMKKFGYKKNFGTFTDVGVLVEEFKISGCNISCGYQKEHTSKETLNLAHLKNCIEFMIELINTIPLDRQYDVKIDYSYPSYYRDFYGSAESWANDSDYPKEKDISHYTFKESHPCDHCSTFDCMNCDKVDCY